MQFDTYTYALFLPLVFLLYWALAQRLRWQNLLLLTASYTFYACWDWRFLALIIFTSITTFSTALAIQHSPQRKKMWASVSIVINLCILFTFKYLDFFRDNTIALFNAMGLHLSWPVLNLVLPVGISFYTFQAISYTIDVKRGDIKPTSNLIAFMVYIAFFPQLVAGPIERAKDLLPQLLVTKRFDYQNAVVGMRQILWGLAKKIVVADSLGSYLDTILYNTHTMSATTIVMAAFIVAVQIYADFSAYSDIAIGSARLLNINLSANFKFPFFSRSWNEFWTRWHITLMTWLRNYVYYPLGGSHCNKWRTALNVMIVFTLSGLWHGASWTYVLWGMVCGLLMLPHVFHKSHKPCDVVSWRNLHKCFIVFSLFGLTLLIFRAHSITHLEDMCHALVYGSWTTLPMGISALCYIIPFFTIEWIGRKHEFPLQYMPLPTLLRWLIYWGMLSAIAFYSTGQQVSYIYFQF